MKAEQRSPEAEAYRALYRTARWGYCRRAQLARHPLCELCEQAGNVRAATVVNHRIPHKGDPVLFWDPANRQSVCKPHHDGPIQKAEGLGFSPAVNAGGWPIDPKHRANRSSS